MDVFLIDSWDLKKQDEHFKFQRQSVSLSVEIVPLELFYQTICRLIEGICSTWIVSSDTLSGIVNPLD